MYINLSKCYRSFLSEVLCSRGRTASQILYFSPVERRKFSASTRRFITIVVCSISFRSTKQPFLPLSIKSLCPLRTVAIMGKSTVIVSMTAFGNPFLLEVRIKTSNAASKYGTSFRKPKRGYFVL